jgi:hypothetical protein
MAGDARRLEPEPPSAGLSLPVLYGHVPRRGKAMGEALPAATAIASASAGANGEIGG